MSRPRKVDDDVLLAAIIACWDDRGVAPTVRELSEELGLRSTAPMHRYLERLREEGRVSWERGKARTLRVVEAA